MRTLILIGFFFFSVLTGAQDIGLKTRNIDDTTATRTDMFCIFYFKFPGKELPANIFFDSTKIEMPYWNIEQNSDTFAICRLYPRDTGQVVFPEFKFTDSKGKILYKIDIKKEIYFFDPGSQKHILKKVDYERFKQDSIASEIDLKYKEIQTRNTIISDSIGAVRQWLFDSAKRFHCLHDEHFLKTTDTVYNVNYNAGITEIIFETNYSCLNWKNESNAHGTSINTTGEQISEYSTYSGYPSEFQLPACDNFINVKYNTCVIRQKITYSNSVLTNYSFENINRSYKEIIRLHIWTTFDKKGTYNFHGAKIKTLRGNIYCNSFTVNVN